MGRLTALAAILVAAIPAAAAAQYETPVNPPDPAAQLAELIEIYDSVCLRAFPSDDAVARTMAARGASAMGDADGKLGENNPDGAVDPQGKAIDALKKGQQQLAEQMQQGDGDGQNDGPGNSMGRQQSGANNNDPLGRPLHGREFGDDYTVKIPGEIDVQRVRRILEELRRRLADPARPQIELDYLERLLKDY